MNAPTAFDHLRALLEPYAAEMTIKADTPGNFYLEESRSGPKPQMFGAVQAKKNYTALHLFPAYTHPELLDGISPELRGRMQGKSCFNFKAAEQVPTAELAGLIRRCKEALG